MLLNQKINILKLIVILQEKQKDLKKATCYPPLTVNVDDVGSTYANISFDRTMPTDSNWVIQYRDW